MTQPGATARAGEERERPGFALSGRELAGVLVFWIFLAALSAAGRLLDPRIPDLQPSVSSALVALSFIEYAIWAVLTAPIFWLASWLGVEPRRRIGRVLLLVVLGLVVAVCVDAIVGEAREHLLPFRPRGMRPRGGFGPPGPGPGPFEGPWSWLRGLSRLGFLDDLMVYFAVLAAGVARDYFRRYQANRESAARLAAETSLLQAQLAEARLAMLRAQLDPHFLFNTLHAVSALVERDPRGVRRMIARLGELLRHSLDEHEQEIPLARELELLGRYVDIMQIRFQGRIAVTITAPDTAQDALVPTFVLQPLVENAIEHGASKVEGGRVAVSAQRVGDDVVLRVWNNGPAVTGGELAGVGLANTRERVRALYGSAYGVTLRSSADGTVAEVVVPYHGSAELRTALVTPTS